MEITQFLFQHTLPLGRQRIELKEQVFADGLPLLRLTIAENRRFTVIDIDPVSARDWGQALCDWGKATLAQQVTA